MKELKLMTHTINEIIRKLFWDGEEKLTGKE